jgi:hypothetical protein
MRIIFGSILVEFKDIPVFGLLTDYEPEEDNKSIYIKISSSKLLALEWSTNNLIIVTIPPYQEYYKVTVI